MKSWALAVNLKRISRLSQKNNVSSSIESRSFFAVLTSLFDNYIIFSQITDIIGMGDIMVFRLSVHKIALFLGICIYIITAVNGFYSRNDEVETGSIAVTPTLIIDAGHGGLDGGAVGIDGTNESKINLEIAQKLNLLSKLCGIPTIMTRNMEDITYPPSAASISEKKVSDQKARLRLIQDCPNGILYSIHQNSYTNESVSGIHVLYGHTENSRVLGTLLQTQFNATVTNKTNRVAAEISDEIYLLKHCGCTAVLIECGFISNIEECKLLQTPSYQKKLAVTMLGTYLQYLNS